MPDAFNPTEAPVSTLIIIIIIIIVHTRICQPYRPSGGRSCRAAFRGLVWD